MGVDFEPKCTINTWASSAVPQGNRWICRVGCMLSSRLPSLSSWYRCGILRVPSQEQCNPLRPTLLEVCLMPTHPGLCATCQHVKATATKRGSVFYLCLRSQTDASFRKYPPLPVVQCRGYERQDDE